MLHDRVQTRGPDEGAPLETRIAESEVQVEIDRVVGALLADCASLAEAMVAAIQAEIPAYASARPRVVDDVRAHCEAHARLILVVSAANRTPRWDELCFAREAAARRVRHGIPLDALLQAFRVGHRKVWDAIVEEADDTPRGRDAALALARPAMEYNDIAATQVAEAYLKEEQRLLATADRERRDLLENLLAGRLPAPGERLATELDPEGELMVAVAVPDEADAADAHGLQHVADMLAAHAPGTAAPLVVVRQREVVSVFPVAQAAGAVAARALRAAGDALLSRRGISARAGLSTACRGFGGVAHAYEQARHALGRASSARPVIALSEMSPFEYLVASADDGTRHALKEKGRLLLEWDREGVACETLLAYVAADLSIKDAAERLYVHPNTVRYRLHRISEVIGRDVRSLKELMDLVTVIRVADS